MTRQMLKKALRQTAHKIQSLVLTKVRSMDFVYCLNRGWRGRRHLHAAYSGWQTGGSRPLRRVHDDVGRQAVTAIHGDVRALRAWWLFVLREVFSRHISRVSCSTRILLHMCGEGMTGGPDMIKQTSAQGCPCYVHMCFTKYVAPVMSGS